MEYTMLKIGIYLDKNHNEGIDIIEKFKSIVEEKIKINNEKIISTRLSKSDGVINTDKTIYRLITSINQRGDRFHKIYFDQCSQEIYHEILYPMSCLGKLVGIENSVEQL